MAKIKHFGSLSRLLKPLRRELSVDLAEALMRVKADRDLQNRYELLASKNTSGTLTNRERAELESLVEANSVLTVLKMEARAFLERAKAA